MVKVSAYRLKHIQLQIYNFHLEEAIFPEKIAATVSTHKSQKQGFLNFSTRKCIKFPVPLIQIPLPPDSLIFNDCLYDILIVLLIDRLFTSPYGDNLAIPL